MILIGSLSHGVALEGSDIDIIYFCSYFKQK